MSRRLLQHAAEALRAFQRDDVGAAAIQYALIASLVSAFLMGAYLTLGQAQTSNYEYIGTSIDNAMNSPGP